MIRRDKTTPDPYVGWYVKWYFPLFVRYSHELEKVLKVGKLDILPIKYGNSRGDNHMSFWGLGKRRSRFGKYLDRHSISQQEIADESGVSKSTISRLCQPDDFEPNLNTAKKILKALRQHDSNIDYKDFWDM